MPALNGPPAPPPGPGTPESVGVASPPERSIRPSMIATLSTNHAIDVARSVPPRTTVRGPSSMRDKQYQESMGASVCTIVPLLAITVTCASPQLGAHAIDAPSTVIVEPSAGVSAGAVASHLVYCAGSRFDAATH